MTTHNDLPLSGIPVLDRYHVILRSGGRRQAAAATKNLGRRLWQSPPLPQILRYAQNDRGAAS
jgi:hypothetical protein